MVYRYRIATVFGGSGFIGRHLIRRLARTGCVIRVPSRQPADAAFLRTLGSVGQIVPLPVTIRDDRSLAYAIRGADLVINLIGILAPSGGGSSFEAVQAELPGRIARIAKQEGVARLVQMSAIGADAASPSGYASSKAEGERRVLEAFPEATILRPSIVFGPEDGFFNRFGAMSLVSPFLPLIGGGKTRFQPVYVGDVCDAVMQALATPDSMGRTYELGGPRVYTFKELMQLVLKETGRYKRLLEIPWWLATLQGAVLEHLPGKMLTRDQVRLLRKDNVVSGTLPGLAELGVTPTAAEVIIPTYMDKFRIGGRFAAHGAADGPQPGNGGPQPRA
ncbi:complex I NDUFA9 subunit family protein [Rhodospirillum centenum]|uniref:NADH-ubiquinone oxidoreductase subunit, putative n=1 Tax=Rhodospirillum centenum (strain ATCC 51521 / SW) TaxID=414684 RepID=B6IW86_RHOCS|nr:complex I NDUFA9 subunit family protein [Rhodospirillum centenum]ACJ00560.1 NADH-ubiquinone oxidoreductase subunit, putative [Rhodospirillum centenum SW]